MFCFATFFRVASALAVGSWLMGCVGLQSNELPVSSFTARAAAAAEAARVVRVIDADTYIMLSGGSTYRLRLLARRVSVDAPEPDQAFGPQAADSVAKLLPVGRVVLVAKAGMDLYGRTLGAVLLPTATVAAAGWPVPLDSLLVVRGWVGLRPRPAGGRAGGPASSGGPVGPGPVERRGQPSGFAKVVAVFRCMK